VSTRARDQVRVITDEGEFTAFKSIELAHDFAEVASCTFAFGDDGSWRTVARIVQPGRAVRVSLNGYRIFTGRFEAHSEPTSSAQGMQIHVTARTKLSDARVGSADPGLTFKNTTLKAFLLKLFAPLGYGPNDFQFAAAADRNLQTGKRPGYAKPVDLEPIKFDQLKVNPPETIWECGSRVLKWHHLMMWDGADGRIIVGRPDDTQSPLYEFRCYRGAGSEGNNILSIRPSVDWSEQPGEIWVYGHTPGSDVRKSRNRGVAVDLDVAAEFARSGNFNRRVIIPSDGAKSSGYAQAQARREMAARSKAKLAWEVEADGWSQWQGTRGSITFAINTVANVDSNVHPGLGGPFMIHNVQRSLSAEDGPKTKLQLVARGVYDI